MRRILFRMRCPKCNYSYQYEGKEYEIEACPICNHVTLFRDFVEEEKADGKSIN